MHASRSRLARSGVVAGVVCAGWLAGCNAILGIHAPADEILDSGTDLSPASDPPALDLESPYAWAAWPMPNPTSTGLANAPSYAIDAQGLVTDEVTSLQWQQAVDGKLYRWSDAVAYCEGLGLAGGGFRLPSRIELLSLIDFTRSNPLIDPNAFPDTPPERFWSSSPFVGDRSTAWVVNFGFNTGFVFRNDTSNNYRVRCVR